MKNIKTFIWAHRGASGYITENTLDSFLKGIELGADGIESDVSLTRDKDLVFFHDYFIKYNNYKIRPLRLRVSQLKKVDLDDEGRKIPTVDEVFELFKDKKNNAGQLIPFSLDIATLKTGLYLIKKAKQYGMEDRIQLTFDDYRWDRLFRKYNDKVILVDSARVNRWKEYSNCIFYKNYKKLKKFGVTALNIKAEWYTDEFQNDIVRNGFKLYVWNCHDEPIIRKFIEKEVHAIYSNFPDLALKIRKQIQGV
jgi:glycerophosphoryl diester phosphodiesterase